MNSKHSARSVLFGFQFPHHGERSAFTAMAREMRQYDVDVKVFAYPRIAPWLPGRLRSTLARAWYRLNEYRVARDFNRKRTVHYYFPENSAFQAARWRKKGGRLILTCHQPASAEYFVAIKKMGSVGFSRALAAADDIVLMSSEGLDVYRTHFPGARIHVIRYGVDVSYFHRDAPYQPPSPSRMPVRLLTVGNWLRDYDFWGATVRELRRHRHIEATVIGNKDTLQRACTVATADLSSCRFLSGISNHDLKMEYERAHILFLPLKNAWANTAILEAMAMGLPIAVTDLNATREYLGNDGALFFSHRDVHRVASDILALCARPEYCVRQSAELRRRAETDFSWAAIVKKYYDLYMAVSPDP